MRWKNAFQEKHGNENITHISSLDGNSKNTILETLTSRSLFAEKRLVIIDWFPFSGEKSFSGASDIETQILTIIDDIPEEVLVLFISHNPDKRKSGFKQVKKIAEVKEFNISSDDETFQILLQKYRAQIEPDALKRLVFLKWGDLQKSISEIEKLLITPLSSLSWEERWNNIITSQDVNNHIVPEFEESIFVFIDTLLSRDARKIFKELGNLIDFSNLYAIYQSIIANLRVFLYIEYLKSQKKSPNEIGDIMKLWNRTFLIQKFYKSSFKSINTLYKNLLDFDKNMKTWKFVSSDEDNLKRELEAIFLKFVS